MQLLNHKLELTVHAAVAQMFGPCLSFTHVHEHAVLLLLDITVLNLLESISTTLGTEVKQRIGKTFDVRWLSSFRSVDALLTSLPAVVKHLQQANGDSSQSAKERTGMVK